MVPKKVSGHKFGVFDKISIKPSGSEILKNKFYVLEQLSPALKVCFSVKICNSEHKELHRIEFCGILPKPNLI